jgi:hypothetical protein
MQRSGQVVDLEAAPQSADAPIDLVSDWYLKQLDEASPPSDDGSRRSIQRSPYRILDR